MPRTIAERPLQYFILILTAFVLGSSYYLEYGQHLEPCLLCITQRFCTISLLLGTAAICWIKPLQKSKTMSIILTGITLAGLFFASRQLWLQSLDTNELPACLPGFDTLIRYFSWQTTLRGMLWGSANCAEITWRWLNLSLAAWSGLYFLLILTLQSLILFTKKS